MGERANGNGWKGLAVKLALALVGLASFVAVTFASVTWARGEAREDRIVEIEKKQVGFERDIKYIAEGVRRLEDDAGTLPPAKE